MSFVPDGHTTPASGRTHTEIESKYFAKDRYKSLVLICVQYIYLSSFRRTINENSQNLSICVEDIETQMKAFWMRIFSVVLVSITFDERPLAQITIIVWKMSQKFTVCRSDLRVENMENLFLMIFQ